MKKKMNNQAVKRTYTNMIFDFFILDNIGK